MGPVSAEIDDRRPEGGGVRGHFRPRPAPVLHRSLPDRLPPDPDRVLGGRGGRPLPLPARRLRSVWMDTVIEESRRPAQDRRARPRRPRQPDPADDRLGGARGPRRPDHGSGSPTGPSLRTRSTRRSRCSPAPPASQERGWREALRRLRDQLESERRRRPAVAARRGQPLRDRHPLIDSRPADDRSHPPTPRHALLAALALTGLAAGLSACGYSRATRRGLRG